MEEQIFCDGIGRIAIIGGIVRLDLFTYSPTETDANGNPRPILSHRIVMGTDGFLRSSEKVVEAVGLIGRARSQVQPPAAPPPQQPAPPAQPQWPPQPVSPSQPAAAPPPPPPPPAQPSPQPSRSPFP
jgi:hypothetical protein